MNRLSTIAVVVCVCAAPSQERLSHREIPHNRNFDVKRAFDEKFKNAQIRGEVDALLRQLGQGQGGALAEQLRKMVENDPTLLEKAREMLGSNDPKTRELVRGAIDGALKGNPDLGKLNLSPEEMQRQIQQAFGSGRLKETVGSSSRLDSRQSVANEDNRRAWARDLAAWAERMNKNRLAEPLRNSAAVNGLLNDLTKAGLESAKSGRTGEGLDAQLSQWQEYLQTARDWLPDEVPSALRERLNSLDLPTPDFSAPHFDAPAGLGRLPAPAISGIADLLQYAAYIAAAVAAFVLLRRLRPPAGVASRRRSELVASLDADTLANGADLIRAFETLALLRHGEPARTWHHRATAAGFAADERDAADRLAGLYESTRYAPEQSEPTADQLAAARRDLARLTGAI